ncbi:Nn.00g026610.m01.CDS01 [Neocucurbitaria sp. VM-36]
MAPVQTQTITPHQFSNPVNVIRVSGRVSKPPARSTRTSKPLLSHSPQIPTAHPDIDLTLLRNKLLLTCRQYIPSSFLHEALADGIYSRAQRWITPSSQSASKSGKKKRYYVLNTSNFTFQSSGSAWEARILSGGSQPIDAGNGVVIFVKERTEWDAFLRGYRRQGKRAGQLMKLKQKDTERVWRDAWKRKCGMDELDGKKEVNAGPMWVLVKSAIVRIVRGEA